MRVTGTDSSEAQTAYPSALARRVARLLAPAAPAAAVVGFVLWAHIGSGIPVFRTHVYTAPGWEAFKENYGVDAFGADGYFTRATQNGYNLFHSTYEAGARFTRRTAKDRVNSCAGCHSVEDLAYAFVNADRFDAAVGKRISFEERLMRCYSGRLDGFVPTFYDPAVRDLRILARAVAHHRNLGEGARKGGG
jgi:hypothetical protein